MSSIISSSLNQNHHLTLPSSLRDRGISASARTLIASSQSRLSKIDPQDILNKVGKADSTCDRAADAICAWVEQQSKTYRIDEKTVYGILLHEIKEYDLNQPHYSKTGRQQESTFALRNCLLLASQKSHVPLASFEVFTKHEKMLPNKWAYLDTMSSWIPEEQRVMGRWVNESMLKCIHLAKKRPQLEVLLLKGGFGAGKTRLIKEMLREHGDGLDACVIAPDKAKDVVRHYFPKMPHSIAHDQGSAISYKFFNHILPTSSKFVQGTIVYDSALSDPTDLEKYIKMAEGAKSPKKVKVYDVARLDMFRALAVLKRPIFGEDPRIPPGFVIGGATASKLSRIKCMEKVINSTSGAGHEYHYLTCDKQGQNLKEVLTIKGNKVGIADNMQREEVNALLEQEHFQLEKDNTLVLTANEAELTKEIRSQLNHTVKEYVTMLPEKDKQEYGTLFASREIPFKRLPSGTVLTMDNLYDSFNSQFTKHISKSDFMTSLKNIDPKACGDFIASCNKCLTTGAGSISYLDLPLYVALDIHAKLQDDPWAVKK